MVVKNRNTEIKILNRPPYISGMETVRNLSQRPHNNTSRTLLDNISKADHEKEGAKAGAIISFWHLLYDPFLNENGDSNLFLQLGFKTKGARGQEYVNAKYYGLRSIRFVKAAKEVMLKNHFDCVYFGVNPRVERHLNENGQEKQACSSHVEQSAVVWLDIDAKKVNAKDVKKGKKEILRIVEEKLPLEVSAIVDSGNGYHLYLLLDKPYPITDVTSVCQRLEEYLEVADSCHNADRIMRVPFTLNKKDARNPIQTGLIKVTEKRYTLDDFNFLPKQVKTTTPFIRVSLSDMAQAKKIQKEDLMFTKDLELANKLTMTIQEYEKGKDKNQDRSVRDFHCVCQMLKEGLTPDQIRDIFYSFPEGIGDKFYERLEKQGEEAALRYVSVTIEKCKVAVEKEKALYQKMKEQFMEDDRF